MSRRQRMAALGWTVHGDSDDPLRLLVTRYEHDDDEPMLTGDQLIRYEHPFRAIDVTTGEAVEPGASGNVTAPHDGHYRIELLCHHGDGDEPCTSRP